jgi:hypothetical protein
VQLLILASLRVVHPQASSPSFKGALRQSSPKSGRVRLLSSCSSLLPHSSLRTSSKVTSSLSTDRVRQVLLYLLQRCTPLFDLSIWSICIYIRYNNPWASSPSLYRPHPLGHEEVYHNDG